MMEAEKWYEYQKEYQKYGLDMKPERQRQPRSRQQRRTVVINPEIRNRIESRKLAFATVGIAGILCIFIIMVTAFCASLQYDINQMNKDNNAVAGEIENLEAQLYSVSNIGVVESTATDTLGMKYPSEKKRIYLYSDDIPQNGFAEVLRDKAYY